MLCYYIGLQGVGMLPIICTVCTCTVCICTVCTCTVCTCTVISDYQTEHHNTIKWAIEVTTYTCVHIGQFSSVGGAVSNCVLDMLRALATQEMHQCVAGLTGSEASFNQILPTLR